ncbi:MAG: DNA polymerase I [Cyanobacteria bacterium SZAS LIN-3]|nr:DNA polymerase I [Cyanobacteria bacterium SZAS LIN-3]
MADEKTIILVDGSSLAFRMFYALMRTGMKAKDGTPTWAVHGFFSAIFDLIEKQKPDMLAVCFDLSEPTFRHAEFAYYKANRDAMPDDLARQWPIIKEGVKALEIPLYEMAGYEADDVIGTLAKLAEKNGHKALILTGDQDAFQLLEGESQKVQVLMPKDGELVNFDRQKVFDKLAVWPEQIIDYKGLSGDSSDNIPGVKGIGPKTASQLLASYGTIDGIYEHLDEIKSASVRQKLIDGRQNALDSRRLATIKLDVPMEFDFDHCHLTMPNLANVKGYFSGFNFRQLTGRLPRVLSRFSPDGLEPDLSTVEAAAMQISTESPVKEAAKPAPIAATDTPVELAALAGGQLKINFAAADSAPSDSGRAAATTATALLTRVEAQLKPIQSATLIDTKEKLEQLVKDLAQQSLISVDLETTGLNSLDTEIVGYAIAYDPTMIVNDEGRLENKGGSYGGESLKAVYIPVRHAGLSETEQLSPEYVSATLKPILEDPKIGKLAQNCKYEMNVLSLDGISFGPLRFDTMLASYIVNPDEKHGLKDQSERILGYQMTRIDELIGSGRKQITINFAPLDKVAMYAADDARVTLELARYYTGIFDKDQLFLMHEMELPVSRVLAKMEQTGVGLDLPYLEDFSKELSTDLARLETEIYGLAGHGFNINSTQQLQKVLFEELGLKTQGKVKKNSTDASVLESLRSEHEIIGKLLEYRHLSKLRSTYVDSLPREIIKRDNRLHGRFNQTVASTGRLSSSDPNLQNIPIKTEVGRRIRRAFIPGSPDASLISADYSQIELRLLAHMSGDELLIDAFEKNQDIHARTAGEIFDVPIEQVTSEMRRIGKTINFALVYRQGAYSTGVDLGISTKEAQAFIDKYFSRYPKVQGFLQSTIDDAKRNKYSKTVWGRKRYYNNINDSNGMLRSMDERAACNAPIQGSAADLVKLAMVRLDKDLTEAGSRAKVILQVHDELVLEVPDEDIEATKVLVEKAMLLDQPLKVPLKVDFGVAKNWRDAK